MAQSLLCTTLRNPLALSVQLPLFLVPSCAISSNYPQFRSYASHADLPASGPDDKPRRDRSSYPRHPKPDFDLKAPRVAVAKKPKKAKKKTPDPELERKSLSWQAQQLALKTPRVDYGERGPDPSASRKHLQPDFVLNSIQHTRDKSKKRGVSVIRSTAPRLYLKSMQKFELPVPVINPARRKEFPGNPDHGLWQFFYEKKAMQTPEGMANHGRAWTYAELALKSFEDLHALYWVCHKEVNRVMTNTRERKRIHAGYGDFEDEQRIKTIQETCDRIKAVLRDRYHSTQEANSILEGKTPLTKINLAPLEEQLVDNDYYHH